MSQPPPHSYAEARRIRPNQGPNSNSGEQHAKRATGDRQQHALGHELPEQPPPPRAKRGAERELPVAPFGSGQQQVRQIRARDQQDEADGSLEHPDRAIRAAQHLLLQRLHLKEMARPRQRMERDTHALAPVLHETFKLRIRSLCAGAVLQTPDDVEVMVAAILTVRGIQTERQPDLGPVVHQVDATRHDAEDLQTAAVDLDVFSDHRPSAEGRLP